MLQLFKKKKIKKIRVTELIVTFLKKIFEQIYHISQLSDLTSIVTQLIIRCVRLTAKT